VLGNLRLEPEQVFPDGSWLTRIYDSSDRHRERPLFVRAIEYGLEDPGRPGAERYRVQTSILDPKRAPAQELAALYPQRWEFENVMDELRPTSAGPKSSFAPSSRKASTKRPMGTCSRTTRSGPSSTTPPSKPAWIRIAFLSCALCAWCDAALPCPPALFPPHHLALAHRRAIPSRLGVCVPTPRVVKRKMSNYGVKRVEHRNWPQPTLRHAERVLAPLS
jgi:hypothetical protein